MYQETVTQSLGIAAPISPQTLNSGGTASATSGSVDGSKFKRIFAHVNIGSVTSGGAITAQLIESNSSNLSSPSNISGGVKTGLNTSNKQHTLEVRADQLTKRYVGIQLTENGGHDVVVGCTFFGIDAENKPGNAANDSGSVVNQIIV
jgi:hypothetical protein